MSGLFTRYERTRREEVAVAEVTAENIGELATLIKGTVDYSGDEPVLVVPLRDSRDWRVKLGWKVSWDGSQLVNRNGVGTGDSGWSRVKCRDCGHDAHGKGADGEICGFVWQGAAACACVGEGVTS